MADLILSGGVEWIFRDVSSSSVPWNRDNTTFILNWNTTIIKREDSREKTWSWVSNDMVSIDLVMTPNWYNYRQYVFFYQSDGQISSDAWSPIKIKNNLMYPRNLIWMIPTQLKMNLFPIFQQKCLKKVLTLDTLRIYSYLVFIIVHYTSLIWKLKKSGIIDQQCWILCVSA